MLFIWDDRTKIVILSEKRNYVIFFRSIASWKPRTRQYSFTQIIFTDQYGDSEKLRLIRDVFISENQSL